MKALIFPATILLSLLATQPAQSAETVQVNCQCGLWENGYDSETGDIGEHFVKKGFVVFTATFSDSPIDLFVQASRRCREKYKNFDYTSVYQGCRKQ